MQYDSDRAKRIREKVKKGIKPLVTFTVVTYNQEKYIADAVRSALAQTYSPLEIIISDDHSTDQTWEIIQKIVANYSGPHVIRLNRNETNLGVTAHIDKVCALSRGDFLTGCGGDDIALPNKVDVMVDRWARDDYRPIVIYTNGYWMSESGERGGLVMLSIPRVQNRKEFLKNPSTSMPGALAGSSADIRELFGPMNPFHSSSEDNVTAIRGVLIEHLVYEDVPTTLWRQSGLWSGMCDRRYDKFKYWNGMRNAEGIARQALCDAMMLQDEDAIVAMCCYLHESNYRKQCVLRRIWVLPGLFVRAWWNGGRLLHLLRWTYHAVRYRWKFQIRPFLRLDKVAYAPLILRDDIFRKRGVSEA